MIGPVDERDLDVSLPQGLSDRQSSEPAADDGDSHSVPHRVTSHIAVQNVTRYRIIGATCIWLVLGCTAELHRSSLFAGAFKEVGQLAGVRFRFFENIQQHLSCDKILLADLPD